MEEPHKMGINYFWDTSMAGDNLSVVKGLILLFVTHGDDLQCRINNKSCRNLDPPRQYRKKFIALFMKKSLLQMTSMSA